MCTRACVLVTGYIHVPVGLIVDGMYDVWPHVVTHDANIQQGALATIVLILFNKLLTVTSFCGAVNLYFLPRIPVF